MVFLFTLWMAKRIESGFVVHGVLIGVVGIVLFTMMWVATTKSLAQPPLYVVAHLLKILGGIPGGRVVEGEGGESSKSNEHRLAAYPFKAQCSRGLKPRAYIEYSWFVFVYMSDLSDPASFFALVK